MDEFDQVSVKHQGFLKHLLQKPVVNLRKALCYTGGVGEALCFVYCHEQPYGFIG